MRLIDADALERDLFDADWMMDSDEHMVEDILRKMPTIDAVPVVHAHWIKTFNSDGFVSTLRCSECGNSENSTYVPGNFCWFCGARMDGEEE